MFTKVVGKVLQQVKVNIQCWDLIAGDSRITYTVHHLSVIWLGPWLFIWAFSAIYKESYYKTYKTEWTRTLPICKCFRLDGVYRCIWRVILLFFFRRLRLPWILTIGRTNLLDASFGIVAAYFIFFDLVRLCYALQHVFMLSVFVVCLSICLSVCLSACLPTCLPDIRLLQYT
jgi:hypothetical protein